MKTVKIAGVPEHFNLPWHLCIENGEFEEVGIDLQWIDVPEGTGKMCEMLKEGEIDIAVVLTEGCIKAIANDNSSKIVQLFVESPLIWGIHVAAQSEFKTIDDLQNKKVAFSFGSSLAYGFYFNKSKVCRVIPATCSNFDTLN
jgi:ABC-type nitrate/sulfonate/bicarbonate transport system substrate-binding protein